VTVAVLACVGCATGGWSDGPRMRAILEDCALTQRGDQPKPTSLTAEEAANVAQGVLNTAVGESTNFVTGRAAQVYRETPRPKLHGGDFRDLSTRPLTPLERATIERCLREQYSIPVAR